MVEAQNVLIADLEYIEEEFDAIEFKIRNDENVVLKPFHIMIKVDGTITKILPARKMLPKHIMQVHYAPNQIGTGSSVTIEVIIDCYNELNGINKGNTTIKKTFKRKKLINAKGGEINYVE